MSPSRINAGAVLVVARILLLLVLAILIALMLILRAPAFVWTILAAAGLLVAILVIWHSRCTVYQCKACGHEFQITAWTDFVSPHLGGVKLLRCPKCGAVGWCDAERE